MNTYEEPICPFEGCEAEDIHYHRHGRAANYYGPCRCRPADPGHDESNYFATRCYAPRPGNAEPAAKDRVKQKFGVDDDSDQRVLAWLTIAEHPFFSDCYHLDGTLLDAVLAKLDAAHAHAFVPVWRPVTFEEIQPGWEVRTRRRDGSEATWGTAHHQVDPGMTPDRYSAELDAWFTARMATR